MEDVGGFAQGFDFLLFSWNSVIETVELGFYGTEFNLPVPVHVPIVDLPWKSDTPRIRRLT